MPSVFDNIPNVPSSNDSTYFVPGVYTVRLERVALQQSRKGDQLFIVEATVLTSNSPECPVGGKCSQVINLSKHDSALSNIKGFMMAARPTLEVTAAVCAWATSTLAEKDAALLPAGLVRQENPLRGTTMQLVASNIKTRAGGDFTKHAWSSYVAPTGIKLPPV